MRTSSSILLLACTLAFPATAADRSPEAAHRELLATLDAGFGPAAEQTLARAWALVGTFTTTWLDAHPGAKPSALAASLKTLNRPGNVGVSITGDALLLTPSTYVVEAHYAGEPGAVGTFFVVTRTPEGHRVAWSVKPVAAKHFAQNDELGRWHFLADRSYGDGPLYGELHALPPLKDGSPRFAVDATSSGDGGTRVHQLGVWKWDGRDAQPLVLETYLASDATPPARFGPKEIRVPTKEVRSFTTCGACPGPEGEWVIRLTPDGAQSGPHAIVDPDLRFFDELFFRLARGDDATKFAAPEVIVELTRRLKAVDQPAGAFNELRRKGARVELVFDEVTLLFKVERGRAGTFVRDLRVREL